MGTLALALALGLTVSARSLQPGELIVVTIDAPADATPRVRVFQRDLPVFRTGGADGHEWRALAGIDLDVAPGTYTLTASAGSESASRDIVVLAKKFPTRRLTVDENFVTPPPSEAERIAADAALLDRTWKLQTAERYWTTAFVRPVPQPANSAFGTRSIFNGKPRNAHGGADLLSPAGTPIHAPNAGRVVIARSLYYSGNTVVVDHGQGVFSMLAHLSAFEVKEGDTISAGQVVGRVGATGRVTGPHLHWAMRVAGARIDPMSVLALLGDQKPSAGGNAPGHHGR